MNLKIRKTGFTLIELLVVIAIIGVLSGVVMQSISSTRIKSRNAGRLAQIDQIHKALELSATGGTNKLPWPGSSTWFCLGLTTPCAGTLAYINNTTVNNAIAGGIAGGSVGSIPKDPSLVSGIGDAYLYHPNVAPASGNCTASTCPSGAYLSWVIEQSTNCGRGVYWISNVNGITGDSQCVLRIGNAVTN